MKGIRWFFRIILFWNLFDMSSRAYLNRFVPKFSKFWRIFIVNIFLEIFFMNGLENPYPMVLDYTLKKKFGESNKLAIAGGKPHMLCFVFKLWNNYVQSTTYTIGHPWLPILLIE